MGSHTRVTTHGAAIHPYTVTIADTATTSDIIDLQGQTLVSIDTDANLTGTSVTYETSWTRGGTYLPERTDDGTAITTTISASQNISIQPAKTAGFRPFLRVVSGSAQSGSATTITLGVRAVS